MNDADGRGESDAALLIRRDACVDEDDAVAARAPVATAGADVAPMVVDAALFELFVDDRDSDRADESG